MSTVYSGVAASLATGVQITIPADADPDNAATFNVGLQKIADYVEAIRAQAVTASTFLEFCTTQNLNTPGTFFFWAGASALGATLGTQATTNTIGSTIYLVPVACKLRAFTTILTQATGGGTITIEVLKNSGLTGFSATIAAGTALNTVITATGNLALAAGDNLALRIVIGAGVTTGLGQTTAAMAISIA